MTPLPTNVYTIFGVYYVDYGIFGLFFSFFLIGCFSAILEKSYRITKSNSQRVYVALNMSILTLSVFYDYYTTSGVIWMTVLLTPFFFGPLRFANENSAPVALKLGYQNCTS
jgi:oligosaccharide repeat unit polymerase